MRQIARLILRGYQIFISPMLGSHCRYYPSCSQYALDAVERFGIARGTWLALLRLARCHPWHPGGLDPVPTEFHWLVRYRPAGDDAEQDASRPADAGAPSTHPSRQPPSTQSSSKHHG